MSAVVHVVLVSWGPSATPEVREAARVAARSFPSRIPGVLDVAEGPSVSPEGLEQGYDYGVVITFADAAARDAYLPHPVHAELADLIREHSAALVVYDLAVDSA